MISDRITIAQPSDHARIWVYQSNRPFTSEELQELEPRLNQFINNWDSHGDPLDAAGIILYDRFIIFANDDYKSPASGCSIDKSVHFIKSVEQTFQVNMFNRQLVTVKKEDHYQTLTLSALRQLLANDELTPNDLIADTTVQNWLAFRNRFFIPLRESWAWNTVQSSISAK